MSKVLLTAVLVILPLFFAQASTQEQIEAQIPELRYIARNSEGAVLKMNMSEAKFYCDQKGQHLATAREFAQMASRLGAKVLEITAFTSDKAAAKAGFMKVTAGNITLDDSFYFSWADFKNPKISVLAAGFWTSSKVYSLLPDYHHQYVFEGVSGSMRSELASNATGPVLCLPGW